VLVFVDIEVVQGLGLGNSSSSRAMGSSKAVEKEFMELF
jgi:hypothetical protein